jgi:hypothetical protein
MTERISFTYNFGTTPEITDEAIEGLIGQTFSMVGFSKTSPAQVIDAHRDSTGRVEITAEVSDAVVYPLDNWNNTEMTGTL